MFQFIFEMFRRTHDLDGTLVNQLKAGYDWRVKHVGQQEAFDHLYNIIHGRFGARSTNKELA